MWIGEKMAGTTHEHKVKLLGVYDSMEHSGHKKKTQEIFRRNPYKYTSAEVKRKENGL